MRKYVLHVVGWLLFLLLVSGCTKEASADDAIIFAKDSWASNRFYNEVAQFIIEKGYNYETEAVTGSTAAFLTGMANGEVDVHMEMWSKNIGKSYQEMLERGDIQLLSINFDDNVQGFYVPTYVIEGDFERDIEPMAPDLEYISDLTKYWELFEDPEDGTNGRIIGWLTGVETDEVLMEAYEYYGLDEMFNYFNPGSEAALDASIVKAYEAGEAWVGYSYNPHWIMGKYDMTLLKEDEGSHVLEALDAQDIHIIASNSLVDRAPDVAEFLGNFVTSSDVANDALTYIAENDATEYEAAINFLQHNEDMWSNWVSDSVRERVKQALEEL